MGTDTPMEQALLARLRQIGASVGQEVERCEEATQCDLLVITDSALMRNLAKRLVAHRPHIALWVLQADGTLADGLLRAPEPLDHTDIASTLLGIAERTTVAAAIMPTVEHAPIAPPASSGTPIGLLVREHLAARDGDWLLSANGQDLFVLGFGTLTATPLQTGASPAQLLGAVIGQTPHEVVLSRLDPNHMPLTTQPRTALVPLLWQSALRMHLEPTLMAPMDESTVIKLRRWPDFRVLAHRHDDFRLCSLLLRRGHAAREASHLLGIDPGAVFALFNAAYLSGYANLETAPVDSDPSSGGAARGTGRLLAGMWRNLRTRMGS
ncbi:MAG: hypothetical protein ABW178_07115 [Pseudoxanthomonas sp.]